MNNEFIPNLPLVIPPPAKPNGPPYDKFNELLPLPKPKTPP